jgi:hypothetical protein
MLFLTAAFAILCPPPLPVEHPNELEAGSSESPESHDESSELSLSSAAGAAGAERPMLSSIRQYREASSSIYIKK